MRPNHHHLASDFPTLKKKIEELTAVDTHFQRMNDEYELLDAQIRAAETEGGFLSDDVMEPMKKKRALLKDQLYALLIKE
ncbi:MAG: YdcH family protein [Pedobacter sp.]|nr:YdcH family protein [Pedobacter sp.]